MSKTSSKSNPIYHVWLSFSLKKKIWTFTMAVIFTMTLAFLANILTVNYSLYGFGQIMDDNVKSHDFQETIEAETAAFETYMRNPFSWNRESYLEAAENTAAAVDNLPFDYTRIGSLRYARTWSIRNAYASYAESRDTFLANDPSSKEHISTLYQLYQMQDYLDTHAKRLVQITLQEGNNLYLGRMPFLHFLPYLIGSFSAAIAIIILYLSALMHRSMLVPIEELAHASKKIAKNDFTGDDIHVENKDELGDLVRAYNKMRHATEGYITTLEEKYEMTELLHQEAIDRIEMEKALETTRMKMLRSQINPHFLFNTLNMISCMAKLEEAQTTDKMINSLSALFRYNLRTEEAEVPLNQEMKIVDDYMYLQQMRFGDRIRYSKQILVDAAHVIIPSFSLQPLVENAIIHGLSKKEEGGRLHIHIEYYQDTAVRISISDTGVGISRERLAELKQSILERPSSQRGIGLNNIYRRLHIMYQGAEFHVYSLEGHGTVMQMTIPQSGREQGE